jgi:hypothetical protein
VTDALGESAYFETPSRGPMCGRRMLCRLENLLSFDSYLPHRSAANRSSAPRRALYVTYNRLCEGEQRADYYRDKREKFRPSANASPAATTPPAPRSTTWPIPSTVERAHAAQYPFCLPNARLARARAKVPIVQAA